PAWFRVPPLAARRIHARTSRTPPSWPSRPCGLVRHGPAIVDTLPTRHGHSLSGPQTDRVDAAIGLLAGYIDWREVVLARRVPRHPPVAYAILDCSYYLGRHLLVNVPFVGCGIV